MKCPLGLVYRKNFIRTLSSIWNKKSTKDYVIERCKAVSGNCLPIVVIDDNNIVDKAMENILENREVVITHKLTKVKSKPPKT